MGPTNHRQRLDRLDRLAGTMDSLFRIPGTRISVGLDSIVGLVPGVGDALALAPAGYIIAQAADMGAPRRMLVRMAANVGIDALIGAIPLVGDIFDIGWKGNLRNVALLRRHLERDATPQGIADRSPLQQTDPFATSGRGGDVGAKSARNA